MLFYRFYEPQHERQLVREKWRNLYVLKCNSRPVGRSKEDEKTLGILGIGSRSRNLHILDINPRKTGGGADSAPPDRKFYFLI